MKVGRKKLYEKTPGVYLIRSELNGAHYVGGTTNFRKRCREHKSALKTFVCHWYAKEFLPALKANKLTFILLEECPKDCTKKYLKTREQFWMDKYPNRVNLYPNVDGTGIKRSPETRKKISQANKGKPSPMKGHNHTPEAIEKMRQAHKGYSPSAETRRKNGLAHKEKIVSQETRDKQSKAQTGHHRNLGSKRSPETKEKMRQAQLGHKASPETCKKLSEAHLGIKQSKETIEKRRKSLIATWKKKNKNKNKNKKKTP